MAPSWGIPPNIRRVYGALNRGFLEDSPEWQGIEQAIFPRMPPLFALLLTAGFILYLFRHDLRQRSHVSGAIWLPVVWTLIIASRSVGQWLDLAGFRTL